MARHGVALVSCLLLLALAAAAGAQPSYLLFESGPVRPLALSPDGARLYAANTPDGRLEIFDVLGDGTLAHADSVAVGLEPVAVAARGAGEVWVVNYLSDSVSVVDVSGARARVVRTLLVGDEPSDIVFAGPAGNLAFVTTAHRGQNGPTPRGDFASEGVGRADVFVFDADALGGPSDSSLGGTPVAVLTLFSDKPRALAASADGSRVYAAAFRSGNRTTVMNEGHVCNTSNANFNSGAVQPACTLGSGEASPGGAPPPHTDHAGARRPETGLIVQFRRDGATNAWQDELGRSWSGLVRFDLPDRDVFEIDASASPPVAIDASPTCANGAGCWAGVGTTLFDIAVHPLSGKLYVSNTEAQNHVRFEGPGVHADPIKPAGEPASVQGNLAQSRITVLDGANVVPRHLNKHIDYTQLPAPAGVKERSLATPTALLFSADGATLYVAAFGSAKIGVFDTAALENGSFVPDAADHIALSGGGPAGLALAGSRLYVLTRFDNQVKVVDTALATEIQALPLHSPEPASLVAGRPFLYDANLTSSNGEASCSSCHLFGDMDDLAWDLGNPDGDVVANGNPFNPIVPPAGDPLPHVFHPMKGPMATQSLRGLSNHGPQHWRGDRQGDENAAFIAFNAAFPGLLGRASGIPGPDMQAFTDFALQLRYPPNPIRQLDNSLLSDEQAGATLFSGRVTDIVTNCNGCHVLDPAAGFFGGDGRSVFDGETQHMKIPHLRNQYQKVGMFGMAQPEGNLLTFVGPFTHQGPQVRGFGYLHDGSVDSLKRFFGLTGFSMNGSEEDQMRAFMLAFDSDLAPIVGQQVTLTAFNAAQAGPRITLLIQRAAAVFASQILGPGARECDLVASGLENGVRRGWLYAPASNLFLPDDGGAGIADAALRAKAATAGQELTYTCATPGSGQRVALDRDEDALLNGVETGTGVFQGSGDTGTDPALADSDADGFDDGVEVAAATDPNDPQSYPGAPWPPPPVPSLRAGGLAALVLALALAAGAALARPRRSSATRGR